MAICQREGKLEISEWVAVVSVVLAFLYFAIQQRLNRQQSKAEARARQYDRTTALLFKALDDPELLEAISGGSDEDQKQRRFRQLWVNHVEMFFRQRNLFDKHHWKSTVNDMKDFMTMPSMAQYWNDNQRYYADDFRDFVNREVFAQKSGASIAETPLEQDNRDQASIT